MRKYEKGTSKHASHRSSGDRHLKKVNYRKEFETIKKAHREGENECPTYKRRTLIEEQLIPMPTQEKMLVQTECSTESLMEENNAAANCATTKYA